LLKFVSELKLIDRSPSMLEADSLAIRQQLDRILADPLFKNSRRYPKLLQFVVEHTLENSGPELKERTLGVDVFGRVPDYDTGADPVVRMTAAEVRKRLAQYYNVPGREGEIRIGLPAGSYVPEFRQAMTQIISAEQDLAPVMVESLPEIAPRTLRRSGATWWYFAVAAGALVICCTVWWGSRTAITALDAFWNPVLGKSDSVLLSVGQRAEAPAPADTSLSQLYYLQSQNIAVPDAIALARLGGLMQSKHLRYRIRGANETSLSDLRDNPVVLVGAFTNEWNLRLNQPLRFNFERQGSWYRIRDRQDLLHDKWAVDYDAPYLKLTADYALITRVIDPVSGRLVVAAGGLGGFGTQAASEFLTEPAYLQKMAASAPRGWERKNVQVVISTRVINGSSGPPEIVCAAYW